MKSSFLIQFAVIACTFFLVGCNLLSSDLEKVQFQSDHAIYEVGDTVTVSVINNYSKSIFRYTACDHEGKLETITIETRNNGKWQELPPPQGCHPVDPWIEIPAGEVHNLAGVFSEPGEYRYRLGLYSSTSTDNLISISERTSNTFVISED